MSLIRVHFFRPVFCIRRNDNSALHCRHVDFMSAVTKISDGLNIVGIFEHYYAHGSSQGTVFDPWEVSECFSIINHPSFICLLIH